MANDDEIAGVLAHEAGHLHYKDSVLALALLVAGLPTVLLNYLLSIFFVSALVREHLQVADRLSAF